MVKLNKDYSELFLLFTIMIATTILSVEASNYYFSLFNYKIGFDVFIYPLSFLIANLTTKKYGDNQTFFLILISALLLFGYFLYDSFLLPGKSFNINIVLAFIGSFVISQTINLIVYNKLLTTNKLTFLNLILLYIVVITVDSFIKMIALFTIFDCIYFLPTYIIINIIKLLIALVLALTQKKRLVKAFFYYNFFNI